MQTLLVSVTSVIVVSLVSLIGLVTLSLDERRLQRVSTALVSFAVGALLGDSFIHLIPEAFSRDHASALGPSLAVLSGLLGFFMIEKLLRRTQTPLRAGARSGWQPNEIALINLISDAIHNFIDGVLIACSYMVSVPLGLSTTLAVLLHELPQELADFGVLVHSGLSPRKAVLLNLATASVAIAGTLAALLLGGLAQRSAAPLLPVTAGGFVYLAAADLMPELQRERSMRAFAEQAALIALGLAVMGLLALLD